MHRAEQPAGDAETYPEDAMSSRGVVAHRKPGRPATHGARGALAEFRRGERLNYSRAHTKWRAVLAINLAVRLAGRQQWDAVEAALSDRSRPKVSRLKTALDVALAPLDAEKRERVLAAAAVGTAYKLLETYAFRQRSFLGSDGELIPCMRRSFLSYSRDWRRELAAFDAVPEDVELPSLDDYIRQHHGDGQNGSGVHESRPTDPTPEPAAEDAAAPAATPTAGTNGEPTA